MHMYRILCIHALKEYCCTTCCSCRLCKVIQVEEECMYIQSASKLIGMLEISVRGYWGLGYAQKELVSMTCCPTSPEVKGIYICSDWPHLGWGWRSAVTERDQTRKSFKTWGQRCRFSDGPLWKAFIVLYWFVHIKSDRNSCVSNEKTGWER